MSKDSDITASDRWFRGENKTFNIDIVDADEAPIDVSSWELAWMLEEEHDASVDILSKTKAGGEITVTTGAGTNDRVVIAIVAADTEELEPRVYRHALWRTDLAQPILLMSGSIMLQASAAVGVES